MEKDTYVEDVRKGRKEIMESIRACRELDDPESSEKYPRAYSIGTVIEKQIVLSGGGPSGGFKLRFSADKELISGVYYRADWGTYKEVELTDDEAQEVFDFYLGGYIE